MKATARNGLVRVLSKVYRIEGVTWEWIDLPGTEIEFEGVTIGNGETLTWTYETRSDGEVDEVRK